MPYDPALLRSGPTRVCHIPADICRNAQRCQTAVADLICLSACDRDLRLEACTGSVQRKCYQALSLCEPTFLLAPSALLLADHAACRKIMVELYFGGCAW